MIVLSKLILAHLIGDFLVQPKSWVKEKERKKAVTPLLYLHVLIHGALILLLTGKAMLWIPVLIITISHLLIDMVKLYLQKKKNKTIWFIADQGMHLLVLLVVWFCFFDPELDFQSIFQKEVFWAYLTGVIFLTIPSGIIIRTLLSGFSENIEDDSNKSLANAGKYIGIIERLLVLLFISYGHWEAVGFLIAAKSVFRFGDLKESKDRKLTEYILIGTLLSFGMAISVAVLLKSI